YSDNRSFVAVKPRIGNESMKWPCNDQTSIGKVDENTKSSTVTWTVEYDKLSEDVPDPNSLLEFAKNVIKYVVTRLNPTLVNEAEFAQKVGNDIKIP
nr:kirola-like [Tanacetum cinerariifolium]